MYKLMKRTKCSRQHWPPCCWFGKFFTKMLNISTSSVNALHTSLWTWRAEGRTGARSSQTDIYTFYLLGWDSVCVWRQFLVSHSQTVCHILVSVTDWGPGLCDRGTRTDLPELFMSSAVTRCRLPRQWRHKVTLFNCFVESHGFIYL